MIVYHGTLTGKAPHKIYGNTLFHAGTKEAALDRIVHNIESEEFKTEEPYIYVPGTAQIHAYKIEQTAPTSKRRFNDPTDSNPVPEGNIRKIHKYVNEVEDPGSTSLVIPTNFVGRHVTHLGPQFSSNLDNVVARARDYINDVESKKMAALGHVPPMSSGEKQQLYKIYREVK